MKKSIFLFVVLNGIVSLSQTLYIKPGITHKINTSRKDIHDTNFPLDFQFISFNQKRFIPKQGVDVGMGLGYQDKTNKNRFEFSFFLDEARSSSRVSHYSYVIENEEHLYSKSTSGENLMMRIFRFSLGYDRLLIDKSRFRIHSATGINLFSNLGRTNEFIYFVLYDESSYSQIDNDTKLLSITQFPFYINKIVPSLSAGLNIEFLKKSGKSIFELSFNYTQGLREMINISQKISIDNNGNKKSLNFNTRSFASGLYVQLSTKIDLFTFNLKK